MFTRRILNYQLQPDHTQKLLMHKGADVIGVIQKDDGFPWLLAVVDEDAPLEPRTFKIVTTGQVFNYSVLSHVGTVRLGGDNEPWYTAHVFEVETAFALPEHHAEPIDPRNKKYRDDLTALKRELQGKQLVERDEPTNQHQRGDFSKSHYFWPEDD